MVEITSYPGQSGSKTSDFWKYFRYIFLHQPDRLDIDFVWDTEFPFLKNQENQKEEES